MRYKAVYMLLIFQLSLEINILVKNYFFAQMYGYFNKKVYQKPKNSGNINLLFCFKSCKAVDLEFLVSATCNTWKNL